jgi:hypothetical protein
VSEKAAITWRSSNELIVALSCVALALWTYRPVLGNFFSPDDLVLWEWTRGLISAPATLWRYLPGRLYFGLAIGAFGANPYPYMLVNWLVHGLNVALVFVLGRRLGGGVLAATVAAGLFGSSRLFLTAVGQAVGFGDLLALCFVLLASIAMTFPTKLAVVAGSLAFLLALLSKEIVVLLPAALLFAPSVGTSLVTRARRLAPLFLLGVLWIVYLDLSGAKGSVLGGTAYATAFGKNLLDSVLMYAQWSADLRGVAPDFGAERPGHSWIGEWWVIVPVALITWLIRRRSRLPMVGVTWWLAGIVPILPLLLQRHLHYLYTPSVGLALWIGSVGEILLGRAWPASKPQEPVWATVIVLLLGYAALSDSLIRKRYRDQLSDVDLPADSFVRKMEIAHRATSSVRTAVDDRPARLAFYNPLIRGSVDFYTQLLPAVLDQGRALRALYPSIDSVVFVHRWVPELSEFEIVVANEDGRVMYFGRGPDANLRLIRTLAGNGYEQEAVDLLNASVAAYPNDPSLQETFSRYRAQTR